MSIDRREVWRILFVLALMVPSVLGLHASLIRPYYDVADQDMILMTQALLVNEGLPHTYLDHPGYLTIVEAAALVKAAHATGIISIQKTSELTAPQLEDQLQEVAPLGRLLAILNGTLLLAAFALVLHMTVKELQLVVMGTWLLATSMGIFVQTIAFRTEPMSLILLLLALAAIIDCLRSRGPRAVMGAAGAGAAIYLAMLNKVQVGVIFAAFPVLVPVLVETRKTEADPGSEPEAPAAPAAQPDRFYDVAGIFAAFAITVILASASHLHQLAVKVAVGSKLYHWVLLALTIAGMAALAKWRKRKPGPMLASALIATLGFVLAHLGVYYANPVQHIPRNDWAIINFVDHLRSFCTQGCKAIPLDSLTPILAAIGWDGLKAKVDVIRSSSMYPFAGVYWVAVLAAGWAWLKRQRIQAMGAMVVLGFALSLEAIFRLRWLEARPPDYICYYYILVEPFVILAALMALREVFDKVTATRVRRWAVAAVFALLCARGVQVNLDRYTSLGFHGLSLKQDVRNFCFYVTYTPPVAALTKQAGICP